MRDDEGRWRPVPRGLLGGVVLALSVGGCAASETEPPSPPRAETSDASTQADALVQLYAVQRDPIACHRRAVALSQHNDTARVRAWRLMCAEHRHEDGRAMREAARWRATEPDSVWAAFAALGTEQAHQKLGPAAIEKARATWPGVPELMLVASLAGLELDPPTWIDLAAEAADGPFSAVADCHAVVAQLDADIGRVDPSDRAAALESAMRAHWSDPCALMVIRNRARQADLQALATRAMVRRSALLPGSFEAVEELYWHLGRTTELDAAQRAALARAAAERLLQIYPDEPIALSRAMWLRDVAGDETSHRQLGDRLLAEHPDSIFAAWVRSDRILEQLEKASQAPTRADVLAMKQAIDEMAAHPTPLDAELVVNARLIMAHLAVISKDPSLHDLASQTLLDLAPTISMNPHLTFEFVPVAIAFAGRPEVALAVAEIGLRRGEREDPELGDDQAHARIGPRARALEALALVELGRFDEAKVALEAYEAQKLEINALIDYVAGRIALHEGDTHQAEVRLIEAHRRRPIGRPELPTKRWIETVYTQVHGSRRGLERYWSKLEVRSKELRKRAILASRETEPNSLPTFELTDRAGRVRSSADFEGKVGIIHFWGPWCGWCVKELDDYASLAHRYADDSKVVVLSLVSDTLPDELEAFMREHDYGFATALDSGQPERWGIRSYPTTWFINPRGEIEFVASGMTPHLEEEFQWRIEALRK